MTVRLVFPVVFFRKFSHGTSPTCRLRGPYHRKRWSPGARPTFITPACFILVSIFSIDYIIWTGHAFDCWKSEHSYLASTVIWRASSTNKQQATSNNQHCRGDLSGAARKTIPCPTFWWLTPQGVGGSHENLLPSGHEPWQPGGLTRL